MVLQRFAVCMATSAALLANAHEVSAQSFPNKPVRIVATGVGGSGDFAARLIAQGLTASWAQQVIIDNRGDGAIAAGTVVKALPDGYTLLINGSNLWLLQFLRDNVPWDPIKDFSPITLAVSSPNMIVVHPSLSAKSVKELIALAKAKPGTLNYGTSGTGTSNHIAGELFKAMAGVNIVRINYKGTALALNDMIAGQLQLMFSTTASVAPHVKSGRLKALAITSARPSELAPDLPTVAAAGVPGYESVAVLGLFTPAGTPATLVDRLNQEIVRVLNRPDVKEKFFNAGSEIVAGQPQQLVAAMKAEIARMGKVIKDAGIRDE